MPPGQHVYKIETQTGDINTCICPLPGQCHTAALTEPSLSTLPLARPPGPRLVGQGLTKPVFVLSGPPFPRLLILPGEPQPSGRQVPVPGMLHAFLLALRRAQWEPGKKAARKQVLPWGGRCPGRKELLHPFSN